MRWLIVIVIALVAACGSSKPAAKRKAAAREMKCLPVVQERCGCVYPCAAGYRDAHSRYNAFVRRLVSYERALEGRRRRS